MKGRIIVMCTWVLSIASHAQYDERDRLVSFNPLRNGDGSFMKANNPLYYNPAPTDTMWSKKQSISATSKGNPFAFRVRSVQALCDPNSVQLNWTSIQPQADADHFEIEQSADAGISWTNIGRTPASQFRTGSISYNFIYNKALGNVDLRVVAVTSAGEKTYSSIVHSACSNNNLFSVDNLVYSSANVRIGSPKTQNVKMVLTNESGIAMQAREAGLTKGVNSVSIDMSHLHKGIYMLTIIWPGGGQQSAKIVKQ